MEQWELGKDRGYGLKPFCGSFESQSQLDTGQNNEFKVVCKVGGVTKDKTQLLFIALGLLKKFRFFYSRNLLATEWFSFLNIFLDAPRYV